MEKALASTIAGVGLITIGYYSFKQWHHFRRKKSHGPLPISHSCPENVSGKKITEKALTRIKIIENRFFTGVNKKASLSTEEINKLKHAALVCAPTINIGSNINTLQELLVSLRDGKFLFPTEYKEKVLEVFSKADVEMSENIQSHLKLLGETVFDLVEEDLKDQNLEYPWKYDFILHYCYADENLAKEAYKTLSENVEVRNLRIALSDDLGHGEGELRTWENVFDVAIYIFILVSSNFREDEINRYIGEVNLLESLRNPQTRWRVIPIWMEKGIKESKKCPFELLGIQGLKYYLYKDDPKERRILNSIKDLIAKGRRKYYNYSIERRLSE